VSPRANRYAGGTAVTLSAMPDPGQDFLEWSGDAAGTQNPLTRTLQTNTVITARFTKRPQVTLWNCGEPPNEDAIPLQLKGEFGGVFVIETSPDLQQWSPLAKVTNTFGTVQLNVTSPSGRLFYRARTEP
jgi:hypothetical protein